MKEERKRRQIERYLQQATKERPLEEKRALRRHVRGRKANRAASAAPRRDTDPDTLEDAPTFEKLRHAAKLAGESDGAERRRRAERLIAASEGAEAHGLVLGVGRAVAAVHPDGLDAEIEAELAGDIAQVQRSAIAVGDRVGLGRRDDGSWRVVHVEERRSRLSRPDPTVPTRERLIAANVDLGLIVLAAAQPAPHLGLIDRMLLAIGDGGARAAVCLNKIDLLDATERAALDAELGSYRDQGVACVLASTLTGEGVAEIRELMDGRTSVLLGPSGVGKSSMLNALVPGIERAVGEVRESDGKGRHTTTASRLLRMDEHTCIIDTPGIRSFGLWAIEPEALERYIAGVAAPGESCRFRNCIHDREPGCAVRAAVERGAFPASRHERYLRMREEL